MTQPIIINQLNFILSNGKAVFDDLSLTLGKHHTGLVGKNGSGKSTLLKLMVGELPLQSGSIHSPSTIAYVPQNPPDSHDVTIAEFLGFAEKINALLRIQNASIDERDFEILNEDWLIGERLQQQLATFGLHPIPYQTRMANLSGGEITRLLLTKAFFSGADFLLLDEPTNHLDQRGRLQLYQAIEKWQGGLVIASHDRRLLNRMDEIVELNSLGIAVYGGNYDYFVEQKAIEKAARELQWHDAKKMFNKTKRSMQSSIEKHGQKQSYGRELRKSGGIDKMLADKAKERSERSQNQLRIKEERLLRQAETQLQAARDKIEIDDEIHVELPATQVPNGKIIVEIEDLSFAYANGEDDEGEGDADVHPYSNDHVYAAKPIFTNFNLIMVGPKRIAIAGDNGSGKTTLVNLILGQLKATHGNIFLGTPYICYLDQHARLLNPELSVLDNFLALNPEAKTQDAYQNLASFLFKNVAASQLVKHLSGGEKLRALLACVLMAKHPPQLLILDEPTNHLDIHSLHSIESALKHYQGALMVISHDQQFLENIGVEEIIDL